MENPADLFLLPVDDYDRDVVREGNDVCQRLNLPEHVRRIVWLDRVPGHTVHSDECYFHGKQAFFPARMKKRLEPKEWRPLIASSRMFLHIQTNIPGRVLLTMPAIFLTLIGAVPIAQIFGADIGTTMGLLLLVIYGPIFVNGFTQGRKKLKLQADLLAAKAEGKEEFLSVLGKIRELTLGDVLRTDRRRLSRHFSSKPSLSERMYNLELFKEQLVSP
jgi:hypothetical protein